MIGPLTSAALWMAGFWLEIFLWSILALALYSWLFQYYLTRYLVAYPGLVLLWNLGGWLFCFCMWFIYTLFDLFYSAFFTEAGAAKASENYMDWLGTIFTISTIVVTFFCLRFIYKEETAYWEYKRLQMKNKT